MHFASVLIFCIGFFFGFHGAVGNDADHIVPHGGKTAVHHGVKHGLAVQQCVRGPSPAQAPPEDGLR